MEKLKSRFSLGKKFIVGFVIFALLLAAGVCVIGSLTIRGLFMDFYERSAMSAATLAAKLVSPAEAKRYHADPTEDERYETAFRVLDDVKRSTGMLYVYLFYPEPEGYFYIYDARGENESPAELCALGQLDPYPGTHDNLDAAFKTGKPVDTLLVTDSALFGYVGTVFVPVLDESGKSAAMIGVDVAMPEINRRIRQFLALTLGTMLVVMAVLILLFIVYLNRSLIFPLLRLTKSVENYASGGGLCYEDAGVKTGDELERLSGAFSDMAGKVAEYTENIRRVTAEKQRIATELDVAAKIQMDVLPRIFPPFPNRPEFDIFALIRPAKEVGGDFYDFYMLGENKLAFTVSDVSGKGVPAALFMMIAKALLKTGAQDGKAPEDVMRNASDQLCEGNEQSMFVTSLLMIYDMAAHTLTYVNAGHNPPLLRRAAGCFEYLELKRAMPLAAIEGIRYKAFQTPFEKGDCIFLYTDGVTEAQNAAEELYGDAALKTALNEICKNEPNVREIPEKMLARLDAYADGAPQFDDITMLAFKANM